MTARAVRLGQELDLDSRAVSFKEFRDLGRRVFRSVIESKKGLGLDRKP